MTRKSDIELPLLRLWRIERDMTQQQLAEVSGVSRGTIVRAERGGAISELKAHKLAKVFGFSLRELREMEGKQGQS